VRARLLGRFGPEAGLEVEFGGEATIGRGQENSVPLSSREVSQRHARVFFDADSGAYWVEDLGSLNGTLLDGEPVSGRCRLGDLHVLTFGAESELFFLALDRRPEEPAEEPAAASRRTRVDGEAPTLPPGLRAAGERAPGSPSPGSATRVDEAPAGLPPGLAAGEPPVPAVGCFVLEIRGGEGGRFELREGDNLIGRSGRARVFLRRKELSRRHATLRVEGDRVWLRDEGSRNHTFVGGEQITGEVELEAGSELRFGTIEALLSRPGGGGEQA
jgi:pSer/pThr/pTyr-binding forkhead associated (FHA) protein